MSDTIENLKDMSYLLGIQWELKRSLTLGRWKCIHAIEQVLFNLVRAFSFLHSLFGYNSQAFICLQSIKRVKCSLVTVLVKSLVHYSVLYPLHKCGNHTTKNVINIFYQQDKNKYKITLVKLSNSAGNVTSTMFMHKIHAWLELHYDALECYFNNYLFLFCQWSTHTWVDLNISIIQWSLSRLIMFDVIIIFQIKQVVIVHLTMGKFARNTSLVLAGFGSMILPKIGEDGWMKRLRQIYGTIWFRNWLEHVALLPRYLSQTFS